MIKHIVESCANNDFCCCDDYFSLSDTITLDEYEKYIRDNLTYYGLEFLANFKLEFTKYWLDKGGFKSERHTFFIDDEFTLYINGVES